MRETGHAERSVKDTEFGERAEQGRGGRGACGCRSVGLGVCSRVEQRVWYSANWEEIGQKH